MTHVTIDNLVKEYGSIVAVDDISLEVDDGDLAVLVGPSGCGKTTTLRCVAGLETATSGSITFDGVDVTDESPQQRDTSFVFQDLALYPHMTAYENVKFPLDADGAFSDAEKEEAIQDIAEITDCDEFLDKKVVELSGGQQQRVALARALVRQPQVFLMDEPFSDLDELLKRTLRAKVVRLQQELDITMVHVTHDQEEAMTMGDQIIVMNGGNIAQNADPDTVFAEPSSLFVARFIGSPQINEFHCEVEWDGDTAHLESHEVSFTIEGDAARALENATKDEITAAVRPQHLRWSDQAPSEGVTMAVTAEVAEKIGTKDVLHTRLDENSLEVVAEVDSGSVEEGESGYLAFDTEHLHLFDGTTDDAPRLF